jgi:hypothetical protein
MRPANCKYTMSALGCGLTISVIECPLFHTNYYGNWKKSQVSLLSQD